MRTTMSLPTIAIATLAAVAILGGLTAVPASADCLFVNMNRNPNQVQAFGVATGGALAEVAGSPFSTHSGLGGLGLTVSGGRLYVINKVVPNGAIDGGGGTTGSVSGFTIAADCTLSLLAGSPWITMGADPHSIAADAAGKRLFVGNATDGTIMVFDIAGNGSLSPLAGAPFPSQPAPADLAVSPDGAHLFVSHGASGLGVYDIAVDGTLGEAAGSPFASGGPPLFQGNQMMPGGGRFYAADNANAQIAGFNVGAGGALSPLSGSPYTTGSGPDGVALSPGGFLFAGSSLGSTLGVSAVAENGSLSPVPGSPFAATSPTGLAIKPDGSILFALGHSAEGFFQLDVSAVSAAGALTPVAGSPFAADTVGGAGRLVYYSQPIVILAELPTLSPVALGILAALLTLGAFMILRRSAAPPRARTGRARPD